LVGERTIGKQRPFESGESILEDKNNANSKHLFAENVDLKKVRWISSLYTNFNTKRLHDITEYDASV
jgi:hypothetical protein